jgi:hypothetical protein
VAGRFVVTTPVHDIAAFRVAGAARLQWLVPGFIQQGWQQLFPAIEQSITPLWSAGDPSLDSRYAMIAAPSAAGDVVAAGALVRVIDAYSGIFLT